MFHVTSHKLLFETTLDSSVEAVAIAPKDDGIVAKSGRSLSAWDMDLGHPEATLSALFTPVWYEGYPEPVHAWQSTGTDDFEPKLGLWPLVFGTMKATLYSMLFGVPIALLAAIFTSEFLHKRLRTPLKSLTEMMASLPSVVLGFIAAIIIAPIVQGILPTVLALFFTMPVALLLGAYLWQLLPARTYVRWSGMPRFGAICLSLPF
jgi:phosphate transport system permease protein